MLFEDIKAVSARDLYWDFKRFRYPKEKGHKLVFETNGEYDVYNTSTPFFIDGREVIAGRTELRSNEVSRTVFYEKKGEKWVRIEDAPILDLQDPFITWIGGELVLGGVNVLWDGDRVVKYTTDFYRGTSLYNLEYLFSGPLNMKDVRLVELPDKRIAVFSRPQGQRMLDKFGCIAKIGFTVANSLDEVNAEVIENAPLLRDHFLPDEWGGCNQLHILKNGLIGAIGHISWGETVKDIFVIHYYCMVFAIHPDSRMMTPVKVIAARECFPEGPQKNSRAKDVCFTSGLIRLDNGKAMLYSGLSDCEEGCILIDDPLLEYERYEFSG
jgi:hypothetical protein